VPLSHFAGAPRGEQSGLLTRIAATASASLCVRMKSWPRLWNLNRRAIQPNPAPRTSHIAGFAGDLTRVGDCEKEGPGAIVFALAG
jgi:hypothetical protein